MLYEPSGKSNAATICSHTVGRPFLVDSILCPRQRKPTPELSLRSHPNYSLLYSFLGPGFRGPSDGSLSAGQLNSSSFYLRRRFLEKRSERHIASV